jgi:Transposase DDE domain
MGPSTSPHGQLHLAGEERLDLGPPRSRARELRALRPISPFVFTSERGVPFAQIIVAHELTQCGSDQGQLVPLVEAIENDLGRKPEQASADSGYCSEPNLEALVARGIDGYIAPGRAKHPAAANGKVGGPLTQLMRKKIDDGGFETPYRLRKQVVEPVFGQIKQARGFRQFLLRGVEKVRAEWAMICTTHNLLKLFALAKAA